MNQSLGVWSWSYDERRQTGVTRLYQRVSAAYPWICTYFGADVGRGVKANQGYDGRGMMTAAPLVGDFLVKFWLNISNDQIAGSGVGSWYFLNMEACWDQDTGKNCRPYGNANRMVHNQVLLDYGGGDGCHKAGDSSCPPYHVAKNGTLLPSGSHGSGVASAEFPYEAYKFYCCPCTSCGDDLRSPAVNS